MKQISMKPLLSKKQKHLLWKDELGDDFLLLKYCEVYRYSKSAIRVVLFRRKLLAQLEKMGVISNKFFTDDRLCILHVKIEYLPQIIELGAFRRRPHRNGKWIKSKEELLGHRILPYRPKEFL